MIQTAICGVSRIDEIVCEEDRISALSEDLLVMILDLVPTKDAVATMFLSKRWLSVWTMKLRLEYKDSEEEEEEEEDDDSDSGSDDSDDTNSDDDDEHVDSEDDDDEHEEKVEDDEGKKSVWWFLEKSLQLHRAPVIDSLCIELGPSCPTDADVGKWVANAVDRCVLEMKFKLLWSADPAILPNTLYSCESLISLTLSDKILVDVPSSASFPSLKTLDLHHVVYKDDDSVVRFLSSCPVLETLCVKRNKKDDNVTKFTVKLPSLLIFTYDNNRRSPTPNDNDVGDTSGRCLVIDIPSAVSYFRIYDTSGDSCSIHMSCLDSTHMDLVSCPDDKFLVPLSSVSSLVLNLTDALVEWCSTIKFYQLIECTICPEESDWMEPTLLLLGNSPKLKSLTIDYECTYDDEPGDLTLSWNQPSSVPGCVSSQLELFEWKDYGGREEEEQFLKYVLANAKCLKTAVVSLRNTFDLGEQQMIMEALKVIPRVATESQLLFKHKLCIE